MFFVRVVLGLVLVLSVGVGPVFGQEEAGSPPPDEMAPPAVEQPVVVPTPLPTATPAATPTPGALSAADIAARLRPSVVRIISPAGEASGVKVPAGVLTNAHVVGDAKEVELVLADGSHVKGKVERTDTSRDLALISTDANLPAVELEPAAAQHQGDELLVLGFAQGLDGAPSLTRGLISAIRLGDHGLDLVQTDAPTSPGSSGSPYVNTRGKVVGLHSFSTGEGLHFGLATETINAFVAGVQAVAGDPLSTDTAVASRPSPSPFGGNPEDITVRPADLGNGWSVADQQREAPGLMTTGQLLTTFRSPSGRSVTVAVAVFRTRDDVLSFWSDYSRGGSLETCEASFYQGGRDNVTGGCLVQNVIVQMRGASYDETRAALTAAWRRVTAGIQPSAPPPAASGPVFKGAPGAVAVAAGELGPGFTLKETQQEKPNEYSSGRLILTFVDSSDAPVFVTVEVFRDAQSAEAGLKQLTPEGASGARPDGCDAGFAFMTEPLTVGAITIPSLPHVTCRRANVVLRVTGGSLDLGRSAIATMLGRSKPS